MTKLFSNSWNSLNLAPYKAIQLIRNTRQEHNVLLFYFWNGNSQTNAWARKEMVVLVLSEYCYFFHLYIIRIVLLLIAKWWANLPSFLESMLLHLPLVHLVLGPQIRNTYTVSRMVLKYPKLSKWYSYHHFTIFYYFININENFLLKNVKHLYWHNREPWSPKIAL